MSDVINGWGEYVDKFNIILHSTDFDDESLPDVNLCKLYLPGLSYSLKSPNFVIKKGTSMDGLLAIPADGSADELKHHGIKGQRWGVRNGPPYPLEDRSYGNKGNDSKKSKSPAQGETDFRLRKSQSIYRQSDREEMEVRDSSYAAYKKWDVRQYRDDLGSGELGVKPPKEIYTIKMKTKENIKVRNGRSVVKDCVDAIGTSGARKWFEILDKENYFTAEKVTDRYKIWKKTELTMGARAQLGTAIHEYVYSDRAGFAEKYKAQGYSAVIDPEDFVWCYDAPLIITDASKFSIENVTSIPNEHKKESK